MTQTDPNQGYQGNTKEQFNVQGTDLVERVKQIIHEGNVRRIIVRHQDHTVIEIPLTVGVVGVILAPALAAIGAIGALLAECSIEVVRDDVP